jgi:hypothetical protein
VKIAPITWHFLQLGEAVDYDLVNDSGPQFVYSLQLTEYFGIYELTMPRSAWRFWTEAKLRALEISLDVSLTDVALPVRKFKRRFWIHAGVRTPRFCPCPIRSYPQPISRDAARLVPWMDAKEKVYASRLYDRRHQQ